jgi:hypothetical protein
MYRPRRQDTWAPLMLALMVSVVQGVWRMRWFSSCYPPALSDAVCATQHGSIDQPVVACCKSCLRETMLLVLSRKVLLLPSDHPQTKYLYVSA